MRLVLIFISFFFSSLVYSQVIGLQKGFTAGAGVSFFTEYTDSANATSTLPRMALEGGVSAQLNFLKFFGLGIDAKIQSLGAKVISTEQVKDELGNLSWQKYTSDYKFTYLEIPTYAKISVGLGPIGIHAFAGPAIQFRLSSVNIKDYENANLEDVKIRLREDANNYVPAIIGGAGFHIKLPSENYFYTQFRLSFQTEELGVINQSNNQLNAFFMSIGLMY